MVIKAVSWNIGGAKLLAPGSDPTRLASYRVDGLDLIIDWLRRADVDLIALQEAHSSQQVDQVAQIAAGLGYQYFIHDPVSESHIDPDCQLGNGLISRHPIIDHRAGLFANPRLRAVWEDGTIVQNFDEGYSSGWLEIGGTRLLVVNLHLLPLRRFKLELDSDPARVILADVVACLNQLDQPGAKLLLQGDFNINRALAGDCLAGLFGGQLDEVVIDQSTTPKGHKNDHVLYRGLSLLAKSIDSQVRTDHYPITTQFQLLA